MDSRLRDELASLLGERRQQLFDVCGVKAPSERVDALTLLSREVLRASSLCYVDGGLRFFGGECYEPVKMDALVAGYGDILVDMGVSPTDVRRVSEMPFSVIAERTFPHLPLLCFNNGVLDIGKARQIADAYDSYLAWSGEKSLENPDGGAFTSGFSRGRVVTERVPYDYNPGASCPRWDAFLEEVLPCEAERRVLQEFFGMVYLDRSAISVEKFAIMVGQGANGKSVIFEVIKRVLGPDNVSTMDSSQLVDERMIPYLSGKRLNFAPDVRSSASFDSALKALASGQDVTGRRIYGDAEKVTAPPLCFALNEMPRFKDGTPAFFRRILLFSFDVVIPPEKQDKRLVEKICRKDLPGIFNWIMEGRRRLEKQRGEFTKCARMDKALSSLHRDVERDIYPVRKYLDRRGLSPTPLRPGQPWVKLTQNEIVDGLNGQCSRHSITRQMNDLGVQSSRSRELYYKVYLKER